MYYIGYDLGGTKIEGMLLQIGSVKSEKKTIFSIEYQRDFKEIVQLQVLGKFRLPTERLLGYEQMIGKMETILHSLCTEHQISPSLLQGVGFSVPGPVDPISGQIEHSNSMVLKNKAPQNDLKQKTKLDCPFVSENDANCFALAEVLCGAGVCYFKETGIPGNAQTAVGIILGSGCGGGILINGQLLRGQRGGGGEVGHSILYANGHPCYCGRNGCAEQYLCGPALEASINSRLYSQLPARPTAVEIFELYKAKDPVALAVVKRYKQDLAKFLGQLSSILDPHYFVLGGGLSLQNILYENLEEEISRHTYLQGPQGPKVFQHVIGDSAGTLGAALLALNGNSP